MIACWCCGAEPLATYDVTTMADAEPRHLSYWAPSDHACSPNPPTPSELLAEADQQYSTTGWSPTQGGDRG